MSQYKRYLLQAAVAFMVASGGAAWADDTVGVEPQQVGNISFITGGIGDEERDALKAVKDNYDLSITSSSATDAGAYVADMQVVISDREGHELLNTHAGPLFYAELPSGNYVIEGQSRGQSHKQNVTIAHGKTANVHFTWK